MLAFLVILQILPQKKTNLNFEFLQKFEQIHFKDIE